MIIKKYKLKSFTDNRGFFLETYSKKKFKDISKLKFIEDDISFSKKNVLRGFHGDFKTWKLITCIYGNIQIGTINNIKNDKNFKSSKSYILKSDQPSQILVPPGFGVAYLSLTKVAIVSYKQTQYYGENKQFSINYNSPCVKFKWKTKKIIVSNRDKKSPYID